MVVMNGSSHRYPESSSRRFLLLPEDGAESTPRGLQIRRYRLASIGRRGGLSGTDLAMARIAGELVRMGRVGG
jgi:hypothetical protein